MNEEKIERVLKTLNHERPDRVPITEWFWDEFVQRWKTEKGLDEDTDIYEYYDLDLKIISPNMDPRIESCQILEETSEYVIFRSGFGCSVKKDYSSPLPQFFDFPIHSPEEYRNFIFENPNDKRRYKDERRDIVSGDGFTTQCSFLEDVEKNRDKFCIFGSICDPCEVLWRIRGYEGTLMDVALKPEMVKNIVERAADFMIEIGKNEVKKGKFPGLWIWGDIASDKGMLLSPKSYREIFFPSLKKICRALKKEGIKLVYHSDGDMRAILPLLIEAGIDAIDPMQVRAGMNMIELSKKYGKQLAFVGNINIYGSKEEIKKEVLMKLKAVREGGWIGSSSESVGGDVSVENYECFVQVVRKYGRMT